MRFFDPDDERDIIAHMNADHADAILAWALAYTDQQDTQSAMMLTIDADGTDIQCSTASGVTTVRVDFQPPLDTPASVRARLIKLSRDARARLAKAANSGL